MPATERRFGRVAVALLAALAGTMLTASVAGAADLHRGHRHRHYRYVVRAGRIVVPPGYAYGGYGNGPGPGWQDPGYGPGYGYGFAPGYGYVPADGPYTGFDLAY